MISNKVTTKPSYSVNKALEKAIKEIEALNTMQARMARHNKLMAARSAEMRASARGRRFIAKYGDPIDQQNKLPKAQKWG